MKKKLLILPMVSLAAVGLMTSCKPKPDFRIGILQIASAAALDTARASFKEAVKKSPLMKGKRIEFVEKNALGDSVDQTSMAKSLVNRCDLLLGISTPSALALKSARDEAGKDTPLLFTAVTDPVNADLMPSLEAHNSTVTGTSDDNPVEAQIDLILQCFPNKAVGEIKLGIFYTQSESNSEVQADRARTKALEIGFTTSNIYRQTCYGVSDMKQAAQNVAHDVDVLYIPTDNNIADHMDVIKEVTDAEHVLCITGEENMLQGGGHITYSVSYQVLGKRCGEMASDILSGSKRIQEIDAEKHMDVSELSKAYSSRNIADSGITIPSTLLQDFTDVSAQ